MWTLICFCALQDDKWPLMSSVLRTPKNKPRDVTHYGRSQRPCIHGQFRATQTHDKDVLNKRDFSAQRRCFAPLLPLGPLSAIGQPKVAPYCLPACLSMAVICPGQIRRPLEISGSQKTAASTPRFVSHLHVFPLKRFIPF